MRAGAFVPIDAEPVQVFHELGFVLGLGALKVGVFNAQNELSPGPAGEEPIVERSTRIAYVEQTGGGRGKTDTGNLCIHDSY